MYSILYSIEKIIIIHILRVFFWDKTRLAVLLARAKKQGYRVLLKKVLFP